MPRKEKLYHYIYRTTNILNGKFYIGMHSTDNLDDGYIGSGKRLWYSINKYGKENHVCEILEFLSDRKALADREAELVNGELLQESLCMNLKLGGEGGGRFISQEHQHKCSAAGGKKTWMKFIHKMWTPESKRKAVETRKQNGVSFASYGMLDKLHSDDTKHKMSNSQLGENNSQFGTCWIHNEESNMKIKKEMLDHYINNGWIKGRKIKR